MVHIVCICLAVSLEEARERGELQRTYYTLLHVMVGGIRFDKCLCKMYIYRGSFQTVSFQTVFLPFNSQFSAPRPQVHTGLSSSLLKVPPGVLDAAIKAVTQGAGVHVAALVRRTCMQASF